MRATTFCLLCAWGALSSPVEGSCSPEADTDYAGHDLSRAPSTNASSCCGLCTADGQCQAWTLIPDAASTTGATCFLKSSSAGRRTEPGYTSGGSGPKAPTPPPTPASCSPEANTDYDGHDLRHAPSTDASHCCGLCTADGQCQAWTLIPDGTSATGATCFLKSSGAGRRTEPGYTSGGSGPKVPTPPPTPARCATDDDCSLNGLCDAASGACTCDRPWGGADCARLQFRPAPVSACGKACAYHAMDRRNTSWGGSVVQAEDGGGGGRTYVMAAAEMEGGCTLGQWQTNSQVALATAQTPLGPYRKVGVAVGPWSHNPQLVRGADGTWLIFTLGNGTAGPKGPPVMCNGDGDGSDAVSQQKAGVSADRFDAEAPTPALGAAAAAAAAAAADGANITVGFVIHYASSLNGSAPWQPWPVTLSDFRAQDNMDNWNPAPVVLPDGRVRLMIHTDPAPWAGETIYEAPHWKGPYRRLTGDVMAYCSRCQEDPFMWVDARGHWHALLHKMFDDGGDAPSADPVPSPGWAGGHIYSRDGISWSRQQRAYSTNVTLETGEVLLTARRERPKLVFDADGRPTHLTNGAILPGGETYTIIAPLDV